MPLKSRPRCFSSCCLCAGTQSKWACAGALKDGGLPSHSPQALLEIGPAGFHRQLLWEFVFPGQVSKAGEPHKGHGPPLLGVSFSSVASLPLWSACQGRGSDWTVLCASCPSWPGLAFRSSGVEHLFSCLQAIHPQRWCFICSCSLVCLWEEVSSGLSSSPSWSGILKELYLNFSQTHAEFPPLWKSSRMDAHFKALSILGRAFHTKQMWS